MRGGNDWRQSLHHRLKDNFSCYPTLHIASFLTRRDFTYLAVQHSKVGHRVICSDSTSIVYNGPSLSKRAQFPKQGSKPSCRCTQRIRNTTSSYMEVPITKHTTFTRTSTFIRSKRNSGSNVITFQLILYNPEFLQEFVLMITKFTFLEVITLMLKIIKDTSTTYIKFSLILLYKKEDHMEDLLQKGSISPIILITIKSMASLKRDVPLN